ncbi:hypothetical protein MMC18_001734 [Xylographa bjoerkii]|nr:hypothetical protein [Xylographa bjoerkii]
MATFSTVAGTLMQIVGIYNNCICGMTTSHWLFPGNTVVGLATDTQSDRDSSWHWNWAGYTAVVFLACITYLSWWARKFLREKFIQRVKDLGKLNVGPVIIVPPPIVIIRYLPRPQVIDRRAAIYASLADA